MRPPIADGLAKASPPVPRSGFCDRHALAPLGLAPVIPFMRCWGPASTSYASPLVRQLRETQVLMLCNAQTFANRIANLRKPIVKRSKSTMSTFPNLPKPSHKPSRFSTSPTENAQFWGASCAFFKILKKVQDMTSSEFYGGARLRQATPAPQPLCKVAAAVRPAPGLAWLGVAWPSPVGPARPRLQLRPRPARPRPRPRSRLRR